jgi:uncharacterized membrane protein YphA (DoxX/SURF4 family)
MPQRFLKIPFLTCLFLVLLRLAIGWHFFLEGYEKVDSVAQGPTATSKPWSSAGFLRESSGPLSSFFHWQAGGDADDQALARLTAKPVPEGKDPAQVPYHERLPDALNQDWDSYLQRFADYYKLDENQRQEARTKLDQSKERAARWLLGLEGQKDVAHADFPTATYTAKESPLQRINAYKSKLTEIHRAESQELPAFEKDTYRQKLRVLKADAARMRAELLADLEQPMQADLAGVLLSDQKATGAVPAPAQPIVLQYTDLAVSWGLLIIGLCLIFGLLTRPASVLGALFLLTLYLAMPPFPWLPENIRAEGHYLFVNKNLIEALALLVLATLPTGRWVGLDGLLQFFNPWRWRRAAPHSEYQERELVAVGGHRR